MADTPKKQPRAQGAATPKRPAKRRNPRTQAQTAAVPGAPRQHPQMPPLTPSIEAYFGGGDAEHGRARIELIIAERVPQDASKGDVLRLLLEARRLVADPLRGDVYLTRDQARDGREATYTVAAKRDALLAFAERQDDFQGWDARAIYPGDDFQQVDPVPEGTLRERGGIIHRSKGLPAKDVKPIGAWCVVEREGRPPVSFVARMDEYMPTDELDARDPSDPWRRYTDRMIVKAAMCWPLRNVFGLTDVVGAEELTRRTTTVEQPTAAPAIFDDGPRDLIDERILVAYRQARELDPMLWPQARLSARLASAKADAGGNTNTFDELRDALAVEMERDVQTENARRRDPEATRKRLDELRAFGRDTFEDGSDEQREYDTELAALETVARELGIDAAAA